MQTTRSGSIRWQVINKAKIKGQKPDVQAIIKQLLKNRGLKTPTDIRNFLQPPPPEKIDWQKLNIAKTAVKKAVERIKAARKNSEKIIIYGDYDADGICATALIWEALYYEGYDATPYIPARLTEGYGLNAHSVNQLKNEYPNLKLVISVDNGIAAGEEVEAINQSGIDVIIVDHHQKPHRLPKALAIIHTDKVCAAVIAWKLGSQIKKTAGWGLDLVAIGTIADQIPLTGVNRSLVRFGLAELNQTDRVGLLALFKESGLSQGEIGTYAVGFIIAPRLNAAGRLESAIDSLRLLCTKNSQRARQLAVYLGQTNSQRQKLVEEVVIHAKQAALKKQGHSLIIIAHESYHEGVIGLAAAKLVEEYYRPAIVLSRGEKISKASARSIPGFNIIEFIHKYDALIEKGGGHPMAAGFSIRTEKISEFTQMAEEESQKILLGQLLERTLKIDLEIDFNQINYDLARKLAEFEPEGLGNPTPVFLSTGVDILAVKPVGFGGKHLKLKLAQGEEVFDAIAFGQGDNYSRLLTSHKADIVYSLSENIWNGNSNLELKIKDLKT